MSRPGHILLVGFMGAGKSAVGRALAERLGLSHLDTDERIEEAAGASVAGIFDTSGERGFRDLESRILRDLGEISPSVVSTGGGAMIRRSNRELLRELGTTVWIDVPYADLERRLAGGPPRPLWETAGPAARRVLYERRTALYALADLRVPGGAADPEAVAAGVARKLQGEKY